MLLLTVALKIQDTCGTYATVPLITTSVFATAGSSPSIADTSDVFPSPVLPTIATKLPFGISKLTFDNVGFSGWNLKKGNINATDLNIILKQAFNKVDRMTIVFNYKER